MNRDFFNQITEDLQKGLSYDQIRFKHRFSNYTIKKVEKCSGSYDQYLLDQQIRIKNLRNKYGKQQQKSESINIQAIYVQSMIMNIVIAGTGAVLVILALQN